jgi:hypothetical protein
MPENFLPPNVDNVVCDLVSCFRMIVEKCRHARQFPFGNAITRTIIIDDRDLEQWQRHLEEFDAIVGVPRGPLKTPTPNPKDTGEDR